MADNTTTPIGPGTAIATDEIGGVHHQRAKIGFGADGSYGDVSPTNRLPVDIGTGPFSVSGTFFQTTQPISAVSLPLPSGAATQATVATLLTEATFITRQPTLGAKAASGSVPMVLSNDQDPVLDHANAVLATVNNASATVITPPAGARYAVFTPAVDMFVRTDGSPASATAAGSIKLFANVPRDLPIVGGTAVTAVVASGSGELRVTPSKSRT